MSLINQMLRDLDRREASAVERVGLSGQVKALPPPRRVSWPRLLLIGGGTAGALALGTGLWPLFESQPWRHADPVASSPNTVAAMPPSSTAPAAAAGARAPQPTSIAAMPALVVPMPVVKAAPKPAVRRDVSEKPSPPVEPTPAPNAADPVQTATPAPSPQAAAPAVDAAAAINKRPLGPVGEEGVDAEYQRGMAAYRQGQSTEAIARFRSVLTADPRHVAARQALLSMFMAQQRWSEAQAVASEGLALDATQSGWAMTLARLQFEQGNVAEAERTMAAYRRHGERSPDYLAFHGLLLEKLDRRDEARAAYLKARESGKLSPELAEAIEQRLR